MTSSAVLCSPPVPPAPRREPASPFVVWSEEDRRPLEALEPDEAPRALIVDLLADAEGVIDRVLDPARLPSAVLGSLATLALAGAFFSAVMTSFWGPLTMLRAAAISSGNTLLALAAAFGPIYATSILLAARLPFARLVGVLVTSAATGALILASVAPLPYFLWKLDHVWCGPLSVLGAFLISGLVTGARMHRALFVLAERVHKAANSEEPELDLRERRRVGVLARMSLVLVSFTVALAFWGFDAMSKVVG